MKTEKQKQVMDFLVSPRGQYIVSQALYKAIEHMREVEEDWQEKSNIADMQYLLDEVFPMFKTMSQAMSKYAKEAHA